MGTLLTHSWAISGATIYAWLFVLLRSLLKHCYWQHWAWWCFWGVGANGQLEEFPDGEFLQVPVEDGSWWRSHWYGKLGWYGILFWPRPKRESSVVVYAAGLVFMVMRRLSLWEHVKHIAAKPYSHGYERHRRPPAWSVDIYLLIWCFALLEMAGWDCDFQSGSRPISEWSMQSLFAGWLIALELSASLYNLVWRGSLPQLRNQPLYDHTRNLILALLAVLKIAWLFGLIYWWEYNDQFANGGLRNVWEAIYFSFVTTTTVGFGDVQPMVTGGWLKL
ncbi:MAG: two pore domain potassium channel family protein, partial [Planctomycetaceae bacterium]|nr:two pore domain potassium channel family protein [Planctomycetaceae bacterium]